MSESPNALIRRTRAMITTVQDLLLRSGGDRAHRPALTCMLCGLHLLLPRACATPTSTRSVMHKHGSSSGVMLHTAKRAGQPDCAERRGT